MAVPAVSPVGLSPMTENIELPSSGSRAFYRTSKSNEGPEGKDHESSSTVEVDSAVSDTSGAAEDGFGIQHENPSEAQPRLATDYSLLDHPAAMPEDTLTIVRRRLEGLQRYSTCLRSSGSLQQLTEPWLGSTFPRNALREKFEQPAHFVMSHHPTITTDEDLELLKALHRIQQAQLLDTSTSGDLYPLLFSQLLNERHMLAHMGLLGWTHCIKPQLYEVALEFMQSRRRESQPYAGFDVCLELFDSDVCILHLFGSVIVMCDASQHAADQSSRHLPLLIALFIPSIGGWPDSQAALPLLEDLRRILGTLAHQPRADITEMMYLIARSWLRLLWGGYTVRGRLRSSWSDGGEKLDEKLRAYTRNIHDMKAGRFELQRWTQELTHRSQFDNEHKRAAAEATYLDDYISRHVALEALSASRLSILESRRGIGVSEKAMRLTERAERQAHAIGRLTQLAFVFLPLTFVTGIFGMNIKQFNDRAPIWKFWVSLVCVVVPAFLFGLQTARKDIMDRFRQFQEMPSRARSRILRSYGDRHRHDWEDRWINFGVTWDTWRSFSPSEEGPLLEYEEFLDKAKWWNVLVGVGPSAAFSVEFRRVKRRFDRSNVVIAQ